MDISKDRTTLRCYYFIKKLRRLYGINIPYIQMDYYYNQTCKWLRIKHDVYDQEEHNGESCTILNK